jgi:outer membrane protein OmpA-like peptidoglycan-associated protein
MARSFLLRYLRVPLFLSIASIAAPLLQAQPLPVVLANNSGDDTVRGTGTADMLPKVVKVKGVNSGDRDNNPIISADGSVIFFNSTRQAERSWARFNMSRNRYDDDIYYATRSVVRQDEEVWSTPVNLGAMVNSSEDDGIAAISPDGQKVFFSSLKYGWENDGGPFYIAALQGTEWSSITGMSGGITKFFTGRERSSKFRLYGAAISPDGKDFYFATTVNSQSEQHQIWVSHFIDGEWGYPQNLGPKINSGKGNYAPYIAADGKTLFFASYREGGYGGDDIYVSVLKDNEWQTPMNVGVPINTSGDDAFLSVPASGDVAYLSSSREGGDDIFRAPLPDLLRPDKVVLLSGIVTDRVSGLPIEANIVIEDLQSGKTIFNANSNSASGRYTVVLQPGKDYGISVNAPGYVFVSERYTIPKNADYEEFTQHFTVEKLVQGQSFVVNNVFFAYKKDSVTSESAPDLDRLAGLLKENPKLRIEVGGHTDNIGSAKYNEALSYRRADAVKNYLMMNGGIDSSRIETKGYGFDKPAAPNDSEDGRKKNRRTEFTVIDM